MAIEKDCLPEFEALVGKPAPEARFVLCENAADPQDHAGHPEWVREFRQGFTTYGFQVRLLDLRQPVAAPELP